MNIHTQSIAQGFLYIIHAWSSRLRRINFVMANNIFIFLNKQTWTLSILQIYLLLFIFIITQKATIYMIQHCVGY